MHINTCIVSLKEYRGIIYISLWFFISIVYTILAFSCVHICCYTYFINEWSMAYDLDIIMQTVVGMCFAEKPFLASIYYFSKKKKTRNQILWMWKLSISVYGSNEKICFPVAAMSFHRTVVINKLTNKKL